MTSRFRGYAAGVLLLALPERVLLLRHFNPAIRESRSSARGNGKLGQHSRTHRVPIRTFVLPPAAVWWSGGSRPTLCCPPNRKGSRPGQTGVVNHWTEFVGTWTEVLLRRMEVVRHRRYMVGTFSESVRPWMGMARR